MILGRNILVDRSFGLGFKIDNALCFGEHEVGLKIEIGNA